MDLVVLPPTGHCYQCPDPLWLPLRRKQLCPSEAAPPIFTPSFMALVCPDRTQTLGGSCSPYSCPPLHTRPGSPELFWLFLSEQTQASLRPLFIVGRDVALLMLLENMDTTSSPSSPWSYDLPCSHQPFGPQGPSLQAGLSQAPPTKAGSRVSNHVLKSLPLTSYWLIFLQMGILPADRVAVMNTRYSRLTSLKRPPRREAI